nr:MAG TPA: hypothetical protein [Caudoviricetes sp.]
MARYMNQSNTGSGLGFTKPVLSYRGTKEVK